MTKQEAIREGIVEPICDACLPYICAHWDLTPKERLLICKPLRGWVDRILKAEADLGVVIKSDRELPKRDCYACYPSAVDLAQKDMLKAGYVAVEPLIEEVKDD